MTGAAAAELAACHQREVMDVELSKTNQFVLLAFVLLGPIYYRVMKFSKKPRPPFGIHYEPPNRNFESIPLSV